MVDCDHLKNQGAMGLLLGDHQPYTTTTKLGDRQPRTTPTKALPHQVVFFGGWCANCRKLRKRQNTHHPQFCTRDVDRRFCGGGVWISGSEKCFRSKRGIFEGWCTNCQNLREQQNVYHPQDCTGSVHHGFCGGGARIVGFEMLLNLPHDRGGALGPLSSPQPKSFRTHTKAATIGFFTFKAIHHYRKGHVFGLLAKQMVHGFGGSPDRLSSRKSPAQSSQI